MNRFRKMGFINYNGRIHVNKSLLNVVLHDQLAGHNAIGAPIMDAGEEKANVAERPVTAAAAAKGQPK